VTLADALTIGIAVIFGAAVVTWATRSRR